MALYKNNTGSTSKLGHLCKVDPNDSSAMVYTDANETNILGVIANSVPRYDKCEVITTGTAMVYVAERTVSGSVIRAPKSGDNISRATTKTAKATDVPYFRIGTAIDSGKGLIKVALNLAYIYTDRGEEVFLKLDQTTQQTTVGTLHYPTATFGTSVNYTEFEADGTMVMSGDATAWDDSQASAGLFTTGVSSLTLDTLVGGIKQYRFDVNDEIHIPATQFSHSMQVNCQILPHLHIINKVAIGASPQNIKFEFEWAWVNTNGQIITTTNDPLNFDVGGLYVQTKTCYC
jgi:hypothetical protein